MNARKRRRRAIRMPSGTPMPYEKATAATTAPMVSTEDSYRPRTPVTTIPATVNAARRQPPASRPSVPNRAMRAGQPMAWRALVRVSRTVSTMVLGTPKTIS